MSVTKAQVDLFFDQLVDAPFRDERNLMAFPFFSLEKRPRKAPLVYDDGRVSIKIEPSSRGMATIWDKDILIYAASLLFDRMDRGLAVEPTVRFAAHDFLKATKRSTSSRGQELLLDALYRLRNTSILTNIKSGDEVDPRIFGWIADWRAIERIGRGGIKRTVGVEVTLCRWMFDAIVQDRRGLTIAPGYFELIQALERRVYELARKNCGRSKVWRCSMSKLAERCGSLREARKFKAEIKAIAARGGVLDYLVEVEEAVDGAWAVMRPKLFENGSEPELVEGVDAEVSPAAITVSDRAFEKARKLAPGYDLVNLESQWRAWTEANRVVLDDLDAAFVGFVRVHVQRNPL